MVSQVPVGMTHGPGGGQAGPMLQVPGVVHSHASSAASPVGCPAWQPIWLGMAAPLGCCSGTAAAVAGASPRTRTRVTPTAAA